MSRDSKSFNGVNKVDNFSRGTPGPVSSHSTTSTSVIGAIKVPDTSGSISLDEAMAASLLKILKWMEPFWVCLQAFVK